MKYIYMPIALLLSACGGINKQEFFQDSQNNAKYDEIATKYVTEHNCDQLIKLYDFAVLDSPSIADLAKIMPVFELTPDDAKDIDKVYNIDLSVIDKYHCDDNSKQLLAEIKEYCSNKYPKDNYAIKALTDCENYLKQSMFGDFDAKQNKRDIYTKKRLVSMYENNIDFNVKSKIKNIYPIPENSEYLLSEFKASELIKAKDEIIGTYDYTCYFPLCEYNSNNVTKLNSARILYRFCELGNYNMEEECLCFSHDAYQKVNYKNVIYIYEKGDIPQSKQTELNQIFNKCEKKIKQRNKNKDKERYNETNTTISSNDGLGNFVADSVANAVWANKQITNVRKSKRQ